jgi:predicted RNA binding protein YcfA (HicA-like mRNA interferase family)
LKVVSGREFARLAEQRGWRLLRINGSHHIYGKEGNRIRLTIPVHGAAPLKPGLCRHLARQAGIEDLLDV